MHDKTSTPPAGPTQAARSDADSRIRDLRSDGITIIPDYLDASICDDLRLKIRALLDAHPKTTTLVSGTKVEIRSEADPRGPDFGMVDVHQIDRAISGIEAIAKDDRLIRLVEGATGQRVRAGSVHAYVNRGVMNTRGYHADSLRKTQYKALIYLTDVPDETFGPYSYVPGTQRKVTKYKLWNVASNIIQRSRAITDMARFNKSDRRIILGTRGTLILSDQGGFHRGMPQSAGRERYVLVISYLEVE